MDYRKLSFIIVTSQVLCLAGIYCFIFFGQIFYMGSEYSIHQDKKQKANSKLDVDVFIVGNSRANAGFIPDEFKGHSSVNLAVGGSTPIIGYYTIKRYLAHNKPPKVVIMSYSPDYFIDPAEYFWQGALKTHFLDFHEILEVADKARELGECEPFIKSGGGCTRSDIYKYYLDLRNFGGEISIIGIVKKYKENMARFKGLEESKGHFYYGEKSAWHGNFSEVQWKDFSLSPLNAYYMHKISSMAKQYGFTVVLYAMPHNISSDKNLNKNFLDKYMAFHDTLESQYGIIPLNRPYAMPDEAFGDASHLYRGAKEVTHDIRKKLEERGLI